MKNIRLTIEYDGTRFNGWQKQPNQRTIQGEIEKALKKITNQEVCIHGSGRTDKGVHARGQVASFHTQSRIPEDRFKVALNSILPKDITIKNSEQVNNDFHARFSAIGKEYSFLIYNHRIRSSLVREYSYHVKYDLNIERMKRASEDFIGEHDFRSFMTSGSSIKDTVRRIDKFTINRDNNIIKLRVSGNGFLYNMVRIMTGTLIDIGCGKLSEDIIPSILNSRKRDNAGHTAKPQGLYLEKVFY
ncbi:tRNA pseudouridine(38-40) synthase TruA [Sporosalibacterium faouarense]|uniref:tRNA pseudouridine(38-40) synthase TruA n=1 Tax=Sporosalibacterium faouarense TaxID=516123 RepID=UPI00192BF935|nr:tRNA pseudouridine(38-40) synthase TruA [Sporosalibacterium faouarense]